MDKPRHFRVTRKRLASLVIALALGGAATGVLAYMLSQATGSQSITSTVAVPPPAALQVSITNASSFQSVPFAMGVSRQATLTVSNPSTNPQVQLSGFTMSWTSNQGGCDVADLPGTFTYTPDGNTAFPQTINPGSGVPNINGTVTMVNLPSVDQSACAGATITFVFTAH